MEIEVRNDIPVPSQTRQKGPPPQQAKWVFDKLEAYGQSIFIPDTTEKTAKSRFAQWRVRHTKYQLMQIVVRSEKQAGTNGKPIVGVRVWRDEDRTEVEAEAARNARQKLPKKKTRKKPATASSKISTNQVRSQLNKHR